VPYLTPDEIPEDDVCRPLSIPAGTDWLAFFGGALTELTKAYNWQQWGAVSVEDTVAKMQEIIDNWYTVPCEACSTPGGYRVIRIGAGGHIEQLDENGDWVDATDEYHIPPPDAREGGTEQDQICLASANAVNAIKTLYESLSDSFASTLSTIEAFDAMVGVATLYFGFEFAPITYGIYAFLSAIFQGVYLALSYLTADLWTDDFSSQIECFLIDCATNDAGVVTFDWDCFNEHLNSLANDFSLSELQIRLYLQFGFILQFIGGVDGLNLAGGTTELTTADCPCFCTIDLFDSCGYGTVENIGGNRWRVTSGSGAGGQAVCLGSVGDACWGYQNFDMLSGTVTYADGMLCTGSFVGWASACDGSHSTGHPDDIVAQFLFSNAGSFSMEFDVICHEDC